VLEAFPNIKERGAILNLHGLFWQAADLRRGQQVHSPFPFGCAQGQDDNMKEDWLTTES
jgi:hypothetical protein